MTEEQSIVRKRGLIGLCCLLCLFGAAALTAYQGHDELLQGALVRVGVILAAFWLVLGRPPKWKPLSSNWLIGGGIVAAILLPRLRAMFPVLAIIIGIALFAKPKKKKSE